MIGNIISIALTLPSYFFIERLENLLNERKRSCYFFYSTKRDMNNYNPIKYKKVAPRGEFSF